MIEHQEGVPDAAKPPAVALFYDDAAKTVRVAFDRAQVKHWDFVLSVLGMAERAVESQMRMEQIMAMQHAAVEQVAQQQLAKRVLTTRH